MKKHDQGRRRFLRMGGAGLAGAALAAGLPRATGRARPSDHRYLFVISAMGGASIIDSFLPVAESESSQASTRTTLPDSLIVQPPTSNLRCVLPIESRRGDVTFGSGYSQEDFLRRHGEDLAVLTATSSSVNHGSAQYRALTGDGINRGRTIAEAVADRWGEGLVLPNANMAAAGYAEAGSDRSLDVAAQQVSIPEPRFFALSTHGVRGVRGAPDARLVSRSRALRSRLEAASTFHQTFGERHTLSRYDALRARAEQMEAADLISRLMLFGTEEAPLADYGLEPSPLLDRLRGAFPRMAQDHFQAQAALAFLLVRYGVSAAVTLSPDSSVLSQRTPEGTQVLNTQLAFDYAHTDHRVAQTTMWGRVLGVTDALITLLKEEGLWDCSMVYIATEFGREKVRPEGATSFGTSHDLNNGVAVISPMVNGNRVYGGVDPETCMTYGYDPATGEPERDEVMTMRDVYSTIATAFDVGFEGRHEAGAVVRGA